MHEKRFDGDPDRLRSETRLALLEVDEVIRISLAGITAASMVDVGTGSGLFLEAFQQRGLEVSGLDVLPEMLQLAKQYVSMADLRIGVAEELPFPDQFCDLVFMGLVLHETDVPLQALKEARRVGKKRTSILEWKYLDGQEYGPPIEHRLSKEDIKRWAEQAGFVEVVCRELEHMMVYILECEKAEE